jgi:Tfp pilus assembly protein PilN
MRLVKLNHALIAHKVNLTTAILLITGSVLSVTLFAHAYQLSRKTELLQMTIQQLTETTNQPRLSRALLQPSAKADTDKHDEATEVNAAIQEIALPWSALFKSLESVNIANVQLLALEPSARQHALHLSAVAFDNESMMHYVDALAQQKILKNVVLQSQESTDISGQKAILFQVGAVWSI